MSDSFFEKVVTSTQRRVAYRERRGFKGITPCRVRRRDFFAAVRSGGSIRIIAEAKKKSPSAGVLVKRYDPVRLAKIYERSGCDACSVLTEPRFFAGSLQHLKRVKESTRLPVLRKDFIIDPVQIREARHFGADAVLLICKIVEMPLLKKLYRLTRKAGMAALVEVFDAEDLEKALRLGCRIIGINNRDLRTLGVDLQNSFSLMKKIPKKKVVISESGVKTPQQVARLHKAGADALLIGESFVRQKDPSAKIRQLKGVRSPHLTF